MSLCVTLRECNRVFSYMRRKMKQKKKGAVYKTHTFFTHAVKKKNRDTNRNDVKNVLRRKIKQNKKRKTFHAEIWTAGWTNIKSVRARRSHVCRLQHARRFFFRGNMQFICLQHDVKNTLKYFRVHGKVRRRFKTIKTQNILKMSQSSECRGGNNNRNQSWYDNGCTLYKTRTNSHWESLWTQTKKLLKSSWVHLQCTYNMREEISTEFIYT